MHPDDTPPIAAWPTPPHANLEVDERVPLRTLEEIADSSAYNVWAEPIARGAPIPVVDETGDVFAYVFPYARGTNQFPDCEQIFNRVRQLRKEGQAGSEIKEEIAQTGVADSGFDDLRAYLQSFGSIYVSATRRSSPVLIVAHSLSSYYAIGELAWDRAIESLDSRDAALERIYFLGPHEEYFEFVSGERRVLISAHSLAPHSPEEILVPRRHEPGHDEIRRRLKNAWAQLERQELVGIDAHDVSVTHTETRIPHWELLPVIDYTYWCLPTALAMVLGFWDHYKKGKGTITGYGRLVDYWLEHTTNGKNVPNVIDDYMDPKTGGWRGGLFQDAINNTNLYSFSYKEKNGDASNDWAWPLLKSEIDSGRPLVWSISGPINHSVAAFGYRINGAQKRIIVYDAPNQATPTQLSEYDYDQYSGVQPSQTRLHLLRPGGGTGGNHTVIWTPDGGEKIETASVYQINWYVWGNTIKQSRLSFSLDGGRTWTTIASNVQTKVGWNSYEWYPTKATKKARIRVEGCTTAGEYVAGDGSEENFEIKLAPTREVEKYQCGWDHRKHSGVVVLLFKGGGYRQIGPLSHLSYRSFVDALRNERPVRYDPNQDLLLSYHEPVGEEES